MGYFFGFVLVIVGLLILAFGDKKLNVKGGVILKTFSAPSMNVKVLKWAGGIICIWFGAALIFGGGKL
jgi:hypothetical protein